MSLIGGRLLLVCAPPLELAHAAAVSIAVSESAILDVFLKTEFMAIPLVNRIPSIDWGWVG
jgi:hypothetical protein